MPRPPAVSGLVENPRTKIRSASYTRIMEEAEITGRYEVTNVIGASGTWRCSACSTRRVPMT